MGPSWCAEKGELEAHQSSPAVAESREPQPLVAAGELGFSHSLSIEPPFPAPGGARRKPSLSPAREGGKGGAFSFREKGNWALGIEMPRKGHHAGEL